MVVIDMQELIDLIARYKREDGTSDVFLYLDI